MGRRVSERKGRDRYTLREQDEIISLLRKLRRADRAGQRQIRGQLRSAPLRFYITDWADDQRGFTAEDFEALVKRGKIGTVYTATTFERLAGRARALRRGLRAGAANSGDRLRR